MLALIALLSIAQAEPAKEHYEDAAFNIRIVAGARYRTLYDVSIYGGELALTMGSAWGRFRVYGGGVIAYGLTKEKRTSLELRPIGVVVYELGRLGVGFALGLGYLNVARATRENVAWRLSMSLSAVVELDVVRSDAGTFFLAAIGTAEAPTSFVAAGGLGWRY